MEGVSVVAKKVYMGGGGGSGVEGGARRILDLVFSGNGREGNQLSPRDSREGDYRKLTPNLLPLREGGKIKQWGHENIRSDDLFKRLSIVSKFSLSVP